MYLTTKERHVSLSVTHLAISYSIASGCFYKRPRNSYFSSSFLQDFPRQVGTEDLDICLEPWRGKPSSFPSSQPSHHFSKVTVASFLLLEQLQFLSAFRHLCLLFFFLKPFFSNLMYSLVPFYTLSLSSNVFYSKRPSWAILF